MIAIRNAYAAHAKCNVSGVALVLFPPEPSEGWTAAVYDLRLKGIVCMRPVTSPNQEEALRQLGEELLAWIAEDQIKQNATTKTLKDIIREGDEAYE